MQERVIAPVVASFAERSSELAIALTERLRSELPELYGDADSVKAQRASIDASLKSVAAVLREGVDPEEIELPAETVAYARDSARRAVPMAPLLRTYQITHAAFWDLLVPALAARATDRDELAAAIALCSPRVFGYVDKALVLAENEYATERERFARSAAAVRADTIAAVLDRRMIDVATAGSRLQYELDRVHLGVWAWSDSAPESGDAHTVLEGAIVEVARLVAGGGVLLHPMGMYAVAGWVAVPASYDAKALGAVRLPAAEFPRVRVALGDPARGLEGFRTTHVQASSARRVAVLARRAEGSVTRFGAVALQALASMDLDATRAFVHRELGPLAAGDDTSLRLAATLRAYLDEHASRSRAAQRLGVHENTISYRIKQAEEILGRSVERDTLGLRVALALAPIARRDADASS